MASIKYKTEDGYVSIPMSIEAKTNEENGNGIGTCSTSSGTALMVSLTGYELVQNGFVAVTFENDVPANATLNINNKGAKPIYNEGSAIEADVIKAGKTVMFAYDGTNYVVTSLGGEGGEVQVNEVAVISLVSDDSDYQSNLIGATIVVTDNDTSETLLSTTWQGTSIELEIPVPTDYTITVGAVTDFTTPTSQSYSSKTTRTRNVTFEYGHINDVINLGLPSGTKWAKGNIISDGNNGYKIGEETDYGAYVSFGNVTPHFSSNKSTFDDGYQFSQTNYNSSSGASITSSTYPNKGAVYAPNSGYDAARELLGSPWRMPTSEDCQELKDNCTTELVTKDGVYGMELTSTINGAKIFFPATGLGGAQIDFGGSRGYYGTSSLYDASHQHTLGFVGAIYPKGSNYRANGVSVRAVQ